MKTTDLWFNKPDTDTLCRAGGNGPNHPTQLYAIEKYVKSNMTFLDYGCGSGTTLEALIGWVSSYSSEEIPGWQQWLNGSYTGVDIIPKNIKWCKERWSEFNFKVNKPLHKIDYPDNSFDVVYSRHVVDHMKSFEEALDEHCRVARGLVIIVLWRPLGDAKEHEIKNIVDQGKTYKDEYTNDYSRMKVQEALAWKERDGWKVLEMTENVGKEVSGFDTVIVLKKYGK